jgi:hypothetical protein
MNTLSDEYINATVDFYDYVKDAFDQVLETEVTRVTKWTITGIVVLKNGDRYRFTVRKYENSKLTTFNRTKLRR